MRVGRVQLARFYPAEPDRLTPIRWYRCRPDAQIFPHPHTFAFNVWDDPEVKAARQIGFTAALGEWDAGLNHGQAGQEFHGDPAWFLYGIPPEAAGVDGRCIRWGGAFRPALGLAVFAGAFTAIGAPALAVKASYTELPSAYRAALALAAGWADRSQSAGATLALTARGVEAAEFAGAAAAALAAKWTEVQTAAASVALAARWVESSGTFAATLALAVSWTGGINVSAASAGADNFAIVPSVVNGLPFTTVEYDSIGGFDPVNNQWVFSIPAAGVYQWGFSIQYNRDPGPPSPDENCVVIVYRQPSLGAAGHTSNPPLPLTANESWQAYLSGQEVLYPGDYLEVHVIWSNVGGGQLTVSYRLWLEYLGPLPPTPVAAGGTP